MYTYNNFRLLILIIFFLLSNNLAHAQPQPYYSSKPIRLYQSNDSQNPEIFKKIIFTKYNNSLIAISNKGIVFINNESKFLYTQPNQQFASFGYYNTYNKSLSNSNPFIDSQVLSDSTFSITTSNKEGYPLFLRGMDFGISNLRVGVARYPVYGTTSIYKSITLSRKSNPNFEYTLDGKYQEKLEPYPELYLWPNDRFIFVNQNRNQQNDFSALNLVYGQDDYHYFTAINDKFITISSSKRIGGSDVAGTTNVPNIYKFKLGSTLDGSYLFPGTDKPSFQLVGQGKLIHIDTLSNLYTIKADRVLKQVPNSTQSEVVAGGNDAGPSTNQLILNVEAQQPIAFDSNQNMYICDYYNERIVFWHKGGKQGKVLISRELNNLTNFKPISITLDQANNIYVADNFSHSILKFEYCTYMNKPVVQQTTNEDISSNDGMSANWFFNNQLLKNENQSILKPKASGFYQSQSIDLNGCLSPKSDSLLFVCKPIQPEVLKKSKFELTSNIPLDTKTYVDFDFSISNYGTVVLINKSKNVTYYSWSFSDGTLSNEFNPIKTFTSSGKYQIKLTVGNSKNEIFKIEKQVKIELPSNPSSNLIANIPIRGFENIWEDVSGFQNHASFNGKINQLTHRGIEFWPTSNSRLLSSIMMAGCSTENLNEVIVIKNPQQLKDTKAVTLSAWFGLDPSISMNPANGTCGQNGRQVLFSKGGDGYGTSLPGFNALIDINNNVKTLILEFSKNSGNFNISIPISQFIDNASQKLETFEEYYIQDGKAFNSDFQTFYPNIVRKFREGNLVYPFHHFVISFDESRVLVYLNGKKIAEEAHEIPMKEINQQDLYIGALGPKTTPYNGIINWYPFKGRIDRIKVFNKILNDYEMIQLYSEQYHNE